MRITVLADGDEADVFAHVLAAQADPTRHVTYLGVDEVSVRADLAAPDAWRARTWVARDDAGGVVGVLTADVDADRRRVWWLGPWADDADVARALLDAAEEVVGTLAREQEFAPDERNEQLAALALERGCHAEEGSAILVCDLEGWPTTPLPDLALVRPLEPDDHAAVARLHDHVFPNTHTTGQALVGDDETTVLVLGDHEPVGYIATQLQADGGGYVDFLGVAPGARGRGHGRALIAAAMTAMADDGVPVANLTVRVGNERAIALYTSLGFVEERRTVPYRRGFHLGPMR